MFQKKAKCKVDAFREKSAYSKTVQVLCVSGENISCGAKRLEPLASLLSIITFCPASCDNPQSIRTFPYKQ